MTLVEDGAPAAGVVVTWTGAGGLAVSPATSVAGAAGVAQGSAVAGPLAAGVQATGQACAWTTVCASFWAVGVDPSAWRLTVVSGAAQAIAISGTFAPVVLLVTDGHGDPVAGAAVAVHQTGRLGGRHQDLVAPGFVIQRGPVSLTDIGLVA